MLHSYQAAGGERLLLSPDGTAVVKLRGDTRAADPSGPADPLALRAVVAAPDEGPDASLSLRAHALGREGKAPAFHAPSAAVVVGKHRTEQELTTVEGGGLVQWWRS